VAGRSRVSSTQPPEIAAPTAVGEVSFVRRQREDYNT